MKKLTLFILGIVAFSSTSFAQIMPSDVPTPDQFVTPLPTGANMTVGFSGEIFDAYVGGTIGAFADLDGDGSPDCVGAYGVTVGFMGAAIWGDDSTTPEKDGLYAGEIPNFFIEFDGEVYLIDEVPDFTGFIANGITNITGGEIHLMQESYFAGC
jgi:hypothetical protein